MQWDVGISKWAPGKGNEDSSPVITSEAFAGGGNDGVSKDRRAPRTSQRGWSGCRTQLLFGANYSWANYMSLFWGGGPTIQKHRVTQRLVSRAV